MGRADRKQDAGRRITARRVVVPARLSRGARETLTRQLFEVNSRIFSGGSFEDFRDMVVEAPAEATAIELYLDAGGDIVGYCAFHRYRREVAGRRLIVLRAQAGLLPEFRGRGATYEFGIRRALRERLRRPFASIYFLGFLVHTSSYHLFCKYFSRVYPHPDRQTPPGLFALACDLADSFDEKPVSADDPLVRDIHWATIESPQEKALNRQDHRRDVQFFLARNPGYGKGYGLVVLVPMGLGDLVVALARRLVESLGARLGLHHPPL